MFLAAPRATFTPLSNTSNFPRASYLIKRLIDLLQVWVILVEMFMKFLQYWLIMKRNKLFTTNLSKEDKNQRIVYTRCQELQNVPNRWTTVEEAGIQ